MLAHVSLIHERPEHLSAIEALHRRLFGPGRFVRTAHRLREGQPVRFDLSFVALNKADKVVGTVQQTPVRVGNQDVLLLGPLAVDPAYGGQGIGLALMREAIKEAALKGFGVVLLVGDQPYYGRVGFRVVPLGQIQLPGPVDPQRLLFFETQPGALSTLRGTVRKARSVATTASSV